WPQVHTFSSLAEPVDAKYARGVRDLAPDLQPMIEVIRDVVTAEWQHGERVAPHIADFAGGRGRGLRTHRRGSIYTIAPVEAFIDQRHSVCPPASENEGRNRYTLGIFPARVDRRTLRCGHRESCVRMCGLASAPRCPWITLPIDEIGRGDVAHL